MQLNHFTFALIALLVFTSCSKDEESTPVPITKADIFGSVSLYDEGITGIDNSGMTITVQGMPHILATTDVDGKFTLSDVLFGFHTLIYEKSGYGTFKRFGLYHRDEFTTIPDATPLGQKSTTSITNLTVSSNNSFPVIIGATTNPPGNQADTRYIRFFFSTEPSNLLDNYVYWDTHESVLETFPVNISPYNLNLSHAAIDALDYPSGTKVYVKCYGESFWANNYGDYNSNRDFFPNLNSNSAAAVSFIVP